MVGGLSAVFHLSTLVMMAIAHQRLQPSRYKRLLEGIIVDGVAHIAAGTLIVLIGVLAPDTPAIVQAIALVAGLLGLGSGINALLAMRKIGEPIRKAERMMELLSSRVPDRDLHDMGLTDRELDVLGVVVRGRYRDQEIADELFISKATAATHIRNILKKAELSDRRDLLLLGGIGGLRDRSIDDDQPG